MGDITLPDLLAIIAAVSLIAVLVSYLTAPRPAKPECKPHSWGWTGENPGQFNVLKCKACSLVFGPVDEFGRPNRSFHEP